MHPVGAAPPLWTVLPFVALLLAIASLPLIRRHWWENHVNQALVAALFAAPAVAWLLTAGETATLEHSLKDYVSFIALIGSLYVISGGIHLRGSLAGTPMGNSVLMAVGAVLANLIGTTGASMVLIRPLLRANEERKDRAHIVVFFIFVVSNCGGLLTPLGDPPLFLGFLNGVPFVWTLRLWAEWLLVNGLLLIVFHVVDEWKLDREEAAGPEPLLEEVLEHEPLKIEGRRNMLLLLGVVAVMLGRGEGWGTGDAGWPFGIQEAGMIGLTLLSLVITPPAVRKANRFGFGPILEVAVLFLGIFLTMGPPLLYLNAHSQSLGVDRPWEFYWATGLLSSFLDNAPTYLTLAATAAGDFGISVSEPGYLAHLLAAGPDAVRALSAISCGAVMMGANTYIGNGPNFIVKSIAERHGVAMPSFVGYMRWSAVVLLPIFAVITLLFFR
ncbi:MAG TPA: sodium:proton antiporter [Gemmatimonadota bacterium]